MLDKHGNLIKEGHFVKNTTNLIAKVVIKDGHLAAEYPDDHCFYIDDSYAGTLEIVKDVNHWSYMGEK
jgi:hypothetical protein